MKKLQPMKRGSHGEAVKTAQYMLNEKGYACGKEDGQYGEKTERAMQGVSRGKRAEERRHIGRNNVCPVDPGQRDKNRKQRTAGAAHAGADKGV